METATNSIEQTIKLVSLRYNDCMEALSTGNHKTALCLIQGDSNIVCPKQ
jgi:hypothetical protein